MSSFVGVETPWLQAPLFGSRATAFELDQYAIALALLLVVLVPVVASALLGSKGNRLPIVNAPGPFQLEVQKKFEFIHNGMKFLREGRQCFPGKPSVLSEGVLLCTTAIFFYLYLYLFPSSCLSLPLQTSSTKQSRANPRLSAACGPGLTHF